MTRRWIRSWPRINGPVVGAGSATQPGQPRPAHADFVELISTEPGSEYAKGTERVELLYLLCCCGQGEQGR